MASSSIVLILGSGPRIGASVAEKFAKNGYQVATASRKGTDTKDERGYLSLKADLSKPETIPALFDAVKAEFHSSPNVIVYNAGSFTAPPDKDSVLSIPAEKVVGDFVVNTVTPYVAAQQAVKEWALLPKETKKTFIYTGNAMNTTIIPMPAMIDGGMGKAASAFWVGVAAALFADRDYRFFYADERHADGKLKGMQLDGGAHADFYARLATHEANVPWHATFVKDKGYTKF